MQYKFMLASFWALGIGIAVGAPEWNGGMAEIPTTEMANSIHPLTKTKSVLTVLLSATYFLMLVACTLRLLTTLRGLLSTCCFTRDPAHNRGMIHPGQEPTVTVQICTYNEGGVVEETIKRACSVAWPKDKLAVQILDDSTDPRSMEVVERCVARWRSKQVDIVRLTRSQRFGYKGGSLRHHFDSIRTDFVAQLDADHWVESDFLQRAMPYFFEKSGEENDKIGLVQTPWSYYNMHQNVLTEADALDLDVHHVFEQTGRSWHLKAFGFNGTGGIWRKAAIRDAGGWSSETVTEDLALSYDAKCTGYDFVYVRDIPQSLEVPHRFAAYLQQKHRWYKGFLQVFRKSFAGVLFCTKVDTSVKVEMFFHTLEPMNNAIVTLLAILQPLALFHGLDERTIRVRPYGLFIVPLVQYSLAVFFKVAKNDKDCKSVFDRTKRLMFVVPSLALKNGMALFGLKAAIDGLVSDDATFLTTPKVGSSGSAKKGPGGGGGGSASANGARMSLVDDWIGLATMATGVVRTWYFFRQLQGAKFDESIDLFLNFQAMTGFLWVGWMYWSCRLREDELWKPFMALFRKRAWWMALFVVVTLVTFFDSLQVTSRLRQQVRTSHSHHDGPE